MNKLRRLIPPEVWPWLLPVRSSCIAAVGYQPRQAELRLRFRSGDVYRYPAVDRAAYRAFVTAPSLGRAFNATIRPSTP